MDLIPARNKYLEGASPEARSVVAHYTEKYSVRTNNQADPYEGTGSANPRNIYPYDDSLGTQVRPCGGKDNVWLTRKPYVGQNGSIYVMLLDDAGEISGAPIEINLKTDGENLNMAMPAEKPDAVTSIYDGTANPTLSEAIKLVNYYTDELDKDEATYKANKAIIDGWSNASEEETLNALNIVNAYNDGRDVTVGTTNYKFGTNREQYALCAEWKKFLSDTVNAKNLLYLRKFQAGDLFVAFDASGKPIPREKEGLNFVDPTSHAAAAFDDGVANYVDANSAIDNWSLAWGSVPPKGVTSEYVRQIPANATFDSNWYNNSSAPAYCYLLAPSGGVAQPKCFKEGTQFVYKVNVPSILYQDIVLIDYYVEYQHNATQVSILPDKFAPYMYVEGSSLIRRASDGMDLPVEFVIPKLKIKTAISFTFQSTGDPSTFSFQGDAYPDFTKFDLTRKVLADIQILDADDNYDGAAVGASNADPTSYRRYKYNEDTEGDYLWKDAAIEAHSNIDYSDAGYKPNYGGPASVNADSNGNGEIYHN